MTLRKQQCSLDGQRSSQDVGASEESNLLQFFNPHVARDLTCVLLKAFLDESKCSHYNWNCGCLHFPHFCHFNFKVFIFGQLLYFFNRYISDGILMSIIMHVFSFLSLIIMSGLLAFISLSVFTGMSHYIVAVSFSVTFSGLCSYHLSAAGKW